MLFTDDKIKEINKLAPYDYGNEQGIFKQPYGIPTDIKEHVIYMRWESGGVSGGSCWDSSNPQPYTNTDKPKFEILDIVLRNIAPNITYLQYKVIEDLIRNKYESKYEYYGNSTDYEINFIVLTDLENQLDEFKISNIR